MLRVICSVLGLVVSASVTAGRIRWRTLERNAPPSPASSVSIVYQPVTYGGLVKSRSRRPSGAGSQPSSAKKTKISSSPSQKPGIETPPRAVTSANRANRPRRRMPAITPAGTAHSTPSSSAQVDSSRVAGSRERMSVSTGL